jgi:hypothetical protein
MTQGETKMLTKRQYFRDKGVSPGGVCRVPKALGMGSGPVHSAGAGSNLTTFNKLSNLNRFIIMPQRLRQLLFYAFPQQPRPKHFYLWPET